MRAKPFLHRIDADLFIWQVFDRHVQADLTSTAVAVAAGFYLIDPIPLQPEELDSILGPTKVAGIIVTNGNHGRGAVEIAERFNVQVYTQQEGRDAASLPEGVDISDGHMISHELKVLSVDGAAPGEVALYCNRGAGTMIMGDALINFGAHRFSFLPPKYCSNAKRMRRSLEKLLDYRFERILFAHGDPILANGRQRLADLLHEKS